MNDGKYNLCVDCQFHKVKFLSALWSNIMTSVCRKVLKIDYVHGGTRQPQCHEINTDGQCKDFERDHSENDE